MAPKTLQIMSPILLHQLSVQWKMTILEDNLRNENSSYKGEDLEVSSKIKCTSKIKTNLKLTRLSSIESQPKKVDVVVVVVILVVVVVVFVVVGLVVGVVIILRQRTLPLKFGQNWLMLRIVGSLSIG